MLIAVDIGNSTIGIGLFTNPERSSRLIVRKVPVPPTTRAGRTAGSAAAYRRIVAALINEAAPSSRTARSASGKSPVSAVLSSVVPALTGPMAEALTALCGEQPLAVTARLESGLSFGVRHPEKTGADRIATAVAGWGIVGAPVAVIDFGTATTVTVVGKGPRFLGGAILPGIRLMQQSLHTGTARLPLISLTRPKAALGRDTAAAMTSGIINGTAGAVEYLIEGIEKELGYAVELILTGGNAAMLSPLLRRKHRVAPALIFEGMRLLYVMHREQRRNEQSQTSAGRDVR
ncbi:MAG: type III pantothenate kinase [Nitrospirota bacterium]